MLSLEEDWIGEKMVIIYLRVLSSKASFLRLIRSFNASASRRAAAIRPAISLSPFMIQQRRERDEEIEKREETS